MRRSLCHDSLSARMLDDYNSDRTGWARFSLDRRLRYRLARSLTGAPLVVRDHVVQSERRCVFVMLNPSTADAFKLDPTITRCRGFAETWKYDVLEIVNIFALRSTDPRGLRKRGAVLGIDALADDQIAHACRGAERVIAAWGNHGLFVDRGVAVRDALRAHGIPLRRFSLTQHAQPRHPLYVRKTARLSLWR